MFLFEITLNIIIVELYIFKNTGGMVATVVKNVMSHSDMNHVLHKARQCN